MQQTPYCYEIEVEQHVRCEWLFALVNPLPEQGYDRAGAPVTTITVQVGNQAELMGVLNEMHDNRIRIRSVRDTAYARKAQPSTALGERAAP